MSKNWINWKGINFNENNNLNFINSRKFKLIIISFLIIFFIIVNLKIIEVLSLADGKVIPQGRIKYVQHLEGGIVEEILVKEGSKVEQNQPLVVLSKERATSDYEEIDTRLNSIDLSILRINAEKKGIKSLKISSDNKFDKKQLNFELELLKSRLSSMILKENLKNQQLKKLKRILKILKKD